MVKNHELTAPRGAIAPVRPEKRIADTVAELLAAYDRLRDGLLERRPSDVREGLERLKVLDLDKIGKDLAAGRTPATAGEIEAAVGQLIAVTKHLDKVDGPLFHEALVRFIADEQPSRIGLATAMRRVQLTARYTPSIAEVIEALKAAEADFRSAATRLETLPNRIQETEMFPFRST